MTDLISNWLMFAEILDLAVIILFYSLGSGCIYLDQISCVPLVHFVKALHNYVIITSKHFQIYTKNCKINPLRLPVLA